MGMEPEDGGKGGVGVHVSQGTGLIIRLLSQ